MPNTELVELIDNQTKLFSQISGLQEELNSMQTKVGSLDIGADEKQKIQNMSQKMSQYMDELNSTKETISTRMDALERRYQNSSSNSGSQIVAPHKALTKSLCEKLGVESLEGGDARTGLMNLAQKGWTTSLEISPEAMFKGQKTVTSLNTSAGELQIPQYEPSILPPGEEQLTLVRALPMTITNYSRIHWRTEVLSGRVDGTGIQSLDFTGTGQGTALGKSDFVFADHNEEMRTFGHTSDLAIQILQDQGQLNGYIRNRMMYMSNWDLEDQLLFGDNTGMNLNSINAQATAYTPRLSSALNINQVHYLDVLRLAKLQGDNTYIPTTAFLLNRNDIAEIEVLKDNAGRYLFVNNGMPGTPGTIRPWGIPVIASNHFVEDTFYGLPLNQLELCIRKNWMFDISTENKDNFEKLLVTFRIYGRYGIKIYYPNSVIKGTFSGALQ